MRRGMLTKPAPLKRGHDVNSFECDREDLTIWLKKWARRAAENETARTYVVCRGRKVVAFYSLAAGAVAHEGAPSALRRNTPDPIPVIILARLARHSEEKGQKLGAALVVDAMRRAVRAADIIGARAFLVHALDARAADWYRSLDFRPFTTHGQTLFLPMKTVRALAS